MKDKRLKYFQIAALLLISKSHKFTFNGSSYLSSSILEVSFDANDKSKIWIEESGEWTSFTDPKKFKSFIEKII